MKTSIVIMGASGRMGNTLINMVKESEDLELTAVLEREEHAKNLESYTCLHGSSPAKIFAALKKSVIVDFTAPAVSITTAKEAAKHGHAVVMGTTGFTEDQLNELKAIAMQTPIFWAPNMSVGINALLKILPELTKMLGEKYDLEMVELHHNRKKDAPSGTAIKLAEVLAEAKNLTLKNNACYHREGIIGERPKDEIGIQTIRGGDVVGVHTVFYMGPGERIEVTHHAHSRETFAAGALRAARMMANQTAGKLYSFADFF